MQGKLAGHIELVQGPADTARCQASPSLSPALPESWQRAAWAATIS